MSDAIEHPTTTPADAVPLPDLLRSHALAAVIARRAKDAESQLRREVTTRLVDDHKESGTTSRQVVMPGVGRIVNAVLSVPKAAARIADRARFTEWVKVHHPTEVTTSYSFAIRDGFGSADLRARLDALLEEAAPLVVSPVKREAVQPAFEAAVLSSEPTGGAIHWHDSTTGESLPVAGVEVYTPEPHKFSLVTWDEVAATGAVRAALAGTGAARALLGIADGDSHGPAIAGDVVEVQS